MKLKYSENQENALSEDFIIFQLYSIDNNSVFIICISPFGLQSLI